MPVEAFLQEFGFVKDSTPPAPSTPNFKHRSEKQMYTKFVRGMFYIAFADDAELYVD